ncbi:MAG TPA: hypothetical protein VIK26_10975 [Clostridium sp.]
MQNDFIPELVLTEGVAKENEEKRSKVFAIELMKLLGIKQVIPDFRKGTVKRSCIFGNIYKLEPEEVATIKELETKHNFRVYHVVLSEFIDHGIKVEMVHYLGVVKNLYDYFLEYGIKHEEILESIEIGVKVELEMAAIGDVCTYTVHKTLGMREFVNEGFKLDNFGGLVRIA